MAATTTNETKAIDVKKIGGMTEPPKGMHKLITRRRKIDLEHAKSLGYPIHGKLIAHGSMPGREPWNAFIIELLSPAQAVDREGEVSDASVGEEVVVGESAGLRSLIPFASHAKTMVDVYIKVVGRDKNAKGKPWLFDIMISDAMERVAKYNPANYGMGVPVQKIATDVVGGDSDSTPF